MSLVILMRVFTPTTVIRLTVDPLLVVIHVLLLFGWGKA